jgi:hypothetical protein
VILHLPDVTHIDTQVWSVDIGLTDAAVEALRALLAASSAGQAPATDQVHCPFCLDRPFTGPADARDHFTAEHPEQDLVGDGPWPLLKQAPTDQTADRAAALRWAADALGRMDYDTDSSDYGYDTYRDAWNGGVMDAAEKLRRLADETPDPQTTPATFADGGVNDIRALYALHEAITTAGGELTRPVHRAIDNLRAVWDQELHREQNRRPAAGARQDGAES